MQELMHMKQQSTLSRVRRFRTLRLASKRVSLLFTFLALVVIMDAWNLQAQSAALSSRTREQQRKLDAEVGESPGDDNEAAKKQSQPSTPTVVSQPFAFQGSVSRSSGPPKTAIVTWDSRGLEIRAWNSSLNQILREVTARTGARLEGLSADQRIFGNYGPGPGYAVLSQLLEGSGYNVLILESHDTDRPLTVVLSTRLPLSPQILTNSQARRYTENIRPSEPDRPLSNAPATTSSPTNQNPYDIGGSPHDPVQFMQEVLQRQQVIDQQQQDERSHPQ